VAAAHRGERARAVRRIAVTGALGALFLANTVGEWAAADFAIDSHAYGSVFYLLTGFHALHVLGGILLMGAVAGAVAGRSRAPAAATVEVVAAYWHFVDVVWVAVFATVYLLS
jgi:cytochrome c oxidase subunit 3